MPAGSSALVASTTQHTCNRQDPLKLWLHGVNCIRALPSSGVGSASLPLGPTSERRTNIKISYINGRKLLKNLALIFDFNVK